MHEMDALMEVINNMLESVILHVTLSTFKGNYCTSAEHSYAQHNSDT